MSEEAEEAGNYVGVTEAVDGGGNDSQASSHASDDGAHMHDMSSGGASPGESETTPALDADIAVPSGLPKATTGSAKKKRRGGRKKKKSAGAGTHTRFPSEDEEDSTYAALPTSVSASEATSHTLRPHAEAKDDPWLNLSSTDTAYMRVMGV